MIAHVFGAGWVTDAFVQAFTIPNVLRRLTAEGSMTLAFLPLYTEIREHKDPEAAKKFAAKTLGLVLAATTILTGFGILFSPQLVYLFAAGFASSSEKYDLTVLLTRVMFPYLIFVSVVAWAMGVLNAEGRFAAPAAAPILLNIGIIGSAFVISPLLEEPMIGIGIGVLLGGIAQILIQIPSLRKVGHSFKPQNFLNDENIQRLLKLLGPSLLGVAVYQINIIVLRNLASFMPTGQVTHYYNASRLSELILGVFAFAITSASFPELSQHTAAENWEKIRNTLRFTMSTTLLVIFPASIGLAVAAEPIVSMLYLHGAYAWSDVQNTSLTLQAFALSIPAVAMIRLQTSVFFSLKDTRTPVKVSLFSILLTGSSGLVVESKPGNIWLGHRACCRNLVSVDSVVALFAQAIRITQKLVALSVVFALYAGFSRNGRFCLVFQRIWIMGKRTFSCLQLGDFWRNTAWFSFALRIIAFSFQGRASADIEKTYATN